MATRIGSAYFDVTFNTTAARRELTALVAVANRQFGLLGGVALVGATVAIGAAAQATVQLGSAALGMANDYEHAFARVRKTLDDGTLAAEASARVFATLNQELRGLALDVPLDLSTEIAEIAALGGQMGIQRQEIVDFTRVIGELGVTTTLTVEDAATQFARLSNIVGLPSSQFRSMADDLVHLGNNFAATEDEILRFSLRIAAAGEIVGFSESDILALATAMTAVGVPAERGGTAVQRALIRIQKAVSQGSDQLKVFADVSNLTVDQFVAAWREDPARAFEGFIRGVGASGEAAFGILQQTELANERTIQSLLSLANAGDLYSAALDTVAQSQGAAAREADIFFDTTTSKLQLLGNAAQNAGITVGDELQGPFRALIDDLTQWFNDNDDLFEQVGSNLAGALEGVAPIIMSTIDGITRLTTAWTEFLDSLNEPQQATSIGLGPGGAPKGVPGRLDEWQDFLERGPWADPHIARFFDELLPGSVGLATQLTISEDMLRRMVQHGGELSGHRIGAGFNQEAIVDQMTDVEMLVAALVDLDERWSEFGGVKENRWGWDELVDELDLTDEKLRQVATTARELGVELPREILVALGLYAQGLPIELTGPGGISGGPVIAPPLSRQEIAQFELEQYLEDQEAAEKAAEAWATTLKDVQSAASDLNVPIGVLLTNLDRLAPELQAAVDVEGRAAIETTLFAEALTRLQNSIDFDLSDVTDEFDLLLTVTNKAGKEVPATVDQMLADLRKQARQRAEVEAGTLILELLGFDDLAAEIRSYPPGDVITALRGFLGDIDSAVEAEEILDKGGELGEGMLERLKEALATGDITTEMEILVEQFTSAQVKTSVANQANELAGLFGSTLLEALQFRTDIKIPVELIPEIRMQDWLDGRGSIEDSWEPPPTTVRPPRRPNPPPTFELNMYSPSVRTADAVRAGNIVKNLIQAG